MCENTSACTTARTERRPCCQGYHLKIAALEAENAALRVELQTLYDNWTRVLGCWEKDNERKDKEDRKGSAQETSDEYWTLALFTPERKAGD